MAYIGCLILGMLTGQVCMYKSDHPVEELPPECSCNFENLKNMQQKCAFLEETSDTEAKLVKFSV